MSRRNNKDKEKWDIVTDIVVNSILLENHIELPDKTLQISNNFTYKDSKNNIEGCNKKNG